MGPYLTSQLDGISGETTALLVKAFCPYYTPYFTKRVARVWKTQLCDYIHAQRHTVPIRTIVTLGCFMVSLLS